MTKKFQPIFFYITFFLFTLGYYVTANKYDYDLWARLIAGMGFVQSGHVLKHDFLSYTPTHTWFDHEWGSGVIFYLTHHFFSNVGLLFLQVILMFLTFFVITKIVNLRGVKTTSAYNFLFYYFSFSALSYLMSSPIRCQMFSFLFFAVFIYILELARKGECRPLWAMPVIMIVWNNLHGGCVSGIGLIVIYIVGEFLNKKPIRRYFAPLFLSILVLPINPWGFEYLKFLIRAATMPRPYIMEWWGTFSKYYTWKLLPFKIFTLVLILCEVFICGRQLISKIYAGSLEKPILRLKNLGFKGFFAIAVDFDKTKLLVLAATLFLAVQHVKLTPFAVIAFTSFLYDDFYTLFNLLTRDFFNKIAKFKDIIIYGLILIFAISNINARIFKPILTWNIYPLREIEFLKINKIKGNLLTDFGLGSYASYKLYPDNKIYMDGRYEEVYYDSEMTLLRQFFLVQGNWDEILKRFPPDIIIVEKFYPIFPTLKTGTVYNAIGEANQGVGALISTGVAHNQKWALIFEDDIFGVFVKPNAVKKHYIMPSTDIKYYKKTLFDTKINFKK